MTSASGPPAYSPRADVVAILEGHALADLIAARCDHVTGHGMRGEDDDRLIPLALPSSALAYLVRAVEQLLPGALALPEPEPEHPPVTWLLDPALFRPGDARANLVKAAALLLAAVDRLDRAGVPRP